MFFECPGKISFTTAINFLINVCTCSTKSNCRDFYLCVKINYCVGIKRLRRNSFLISPVTGTCAFTLCYSDIESSVPEENCLCDRRWVELFYTINNREGREDCKIFKVFLLLLVLCCIKLHNKRVDAQPWDTDNTLKCFKSPKNQIFFI